jgi:hypothetical protein
MNFYQIESPTTKQIFDAIINNEYTPIEKIKNKAKQIEILLKDYYCSDEILITFTNVTNTGGVPIFLTANCCLYEIASENDEFYSLSQDEQDEEIELLGCYLRTYKDVFGI